MSTLTLKQLMDRQAIALTERSDKKKIASLFDPIRFHIRIICQTIRYAN